MRSVCGVMLVGLAVAAVGSEAQAQFASVRPGDTASMALVMQTPGSPTFINSGGQVNVTRGNTFTNIGRNFENTDNVLARWDEVIINGRNTIIAVWRTQNGAPFVQPQANFFFWRWSMGESNAVSFRDQITGINFVSATALLSDDGGQTLRSIVYSDAFSGSWTGSDPGLLQSGVGDGTNYVETRIEFTPIPAPGAAALLGLAGLVASRRRR